MKKGCFSVSDKMYVPYTFPRNVCEAFILRNTYTLFFQGRTLLSHLWRVCHILTWGQGMEIYLLLPLQLIPQGLPSIH